MSIPVWYNVNFPNDLIFNGENRRFLRIHFPDIINDNNIEYYVSIIPISQNGDINSSFSLNGINIHNLKNYYNDNKILYDCVNVYGTLNVGDTLDANKFEAPASDLWQRVSKGSQFSWRLDYDGHADEVVKLIFIISAYRPEDDSLVFSGSSGSGVGTELPSFSTIIERGIPENTINYGIKGINQYIANTYDKDPSNILASGDIYLIDYIELDIAGYTSIKKESRSELNDFNITAPIYDDSTSSLLLRTNPIISGNVKITVDSTNDIWLNSIDANDNLSDARFKKYKISPNSSYAVDLYNFFDTGTTPTEVVFDLHQYDDQYTSTKKEYHLQYDNFYSYGAMQLKDKLYDEEFNFFAPLWLNKNIPEYFIILKVDHSLSKESYISNNCANISEELLKESKILKTYDLRKGTKIGNYLRNIVNHTSFTNTPVYLSFDANVLSSWTGISYKDGHITEKGEFLYNVFKTDRPIKELDEYITHGFKRNGIICQNMINMEFLFDDTDADLYSINRYLGLYVNEIELTKFDINPLILSKIKEQTPVVRYGIDMQPYSAQDFIQKNNNGIKIPVLITDNKIPLPEHLTDKNKFIAVKCRKDKFFRVESAEDDFLMYDNMSLHYRNYKMYDTKLNLGMMSGIHTLSSQTTATLLNETAGQCILNLYDLTNDIYILDPTEEIIIEWTNNESHHKWILIANETGLQLGDWWDFPVYNMGEKTHSCTFNPKGTPTQVANAIAGCINQFDNRDFDALAVGSKIIIISQFKFSGANNFLITRKFYNENKSSNIKFYDTNINYTYNDNKDTFYAMCNFVGGNSRLRNVAKIDTVDAKNIENDEWFQTQSNNYSNIKTHDVNGNELIALPYLAEPIYIDGKLTDFRQSDDFSIIEITDESLEFYLSNDLKIIAYKIFRPSFSLMSILPIQDFDFDFFFSQYAYSPIGELKRYFDEYTVLPGKNIELPLNEFYKITAAGSDVILEGYINDKWHQIPSMYNVIATEENNSASFEFTNSTTAFVTLNADNHNCLFNTYTPGLCFKNDIINLTHYRRYVPTIKYDKIRIVNNDEFTTLKFQKFLYMNKNKIAVNNGDTILFGEEHIDSDIQSFNGFAALRSIFTTADDGIIGELTNKEDFNRFFYGILLTEYARLNENYLKEWAIKSMVVPYIHKWVNRGTDARDNKYRFNISSAFGSTNLSPSFDITRDASACTHEWLYLDEHPKSYPEELVKNSRGYMFESLNSVPSFSTKTWKELLLDISTDYFTKYFSIGYPHEQYNNNPVLRNRKERFVFTEFINGINEVYTIFHGAKIKFSELNDQFETIRNSSKYDDYKFAAVMTRKSINAYTPNKMYEIELIDNQKYKTICLILTVFIQDSKLLTDLSYSGLYAAINAYKSDSVFKVANVDYENDSSILSWRSMWDLRFDTKNMNMYNYGVVNDFADIETNDEIFIKINAGNLQSAYKLYEEYEGSGQTGLKIPIGKVVSFEGFVNTYYKFNTNIGTYTANSVSFNSLVKHYRRQVSTYAPSNPALITYTDLYNDLFDVDFECVMFYDNDKETFYKYALVESLSWSSSGGRDEAFFKLNAGQNFNINAINKISFAEIQNEMNQYYPTDIDSNISYITITETGDLLYDRFRIDFIEHTKFIKNAVKNIIKDSDKPNQLKNIDTIGYSLISEIKDEILFRYGGYFAPNKRNIISFWVNEYHDFSSYYEKDFILANTRIGTNLPDVSILKNHMYNKVNDSEILRIVNDSSYNSIYPLINETSISRKDTCIMKSNWDNDYFTRHMNLETTKSIIGTESLIERKSFMGSKMMNVPINYEFYQYNASEYVLFENISLMPNVSSLTDISNTAAIGAAEPNIEIIFDLESRILRDALENNATKELDWIANNVEHPIIKYMTESEKESYITKYINENILKLYTFASITVYYKKTLIEYNKLYSINFNASESLLINTGYKKYDNIKIEKISDLQFKLIIYIDTKSRMDFGIGISINRI